MEGGGEGVLGLLVVVMFTPEYAIIHGRMHCTVALGERTVCVTIFLLPHHMAAPPPPPTKKQKSVQSIYLLFWRVAAEVVPT